jgi:membrane protein implicated in regulation of membrane protease activity
MDLTGKQIQWSCIVIGATIYFFLGALTEIALPIQLGSFVGVAVVLPAIVTRTVSFQQPPTQTNDADDADDEYKY